MKHFFVLMAASVGFLAACSDLNKTDFIDKQNSDGDLVERVIFEAPDIYALGDDDETRASLSQEGENPICFGWEATDTVGIYPDSGAQVYFSMSNGVGSNVASFDGGGWALRQGSTYSCYYPFVGNMYLKRDAIPVSFTNQIQKGVSDYTGIRFYLASEGTSSSEGELHFSFQMLNTVIRIKAIGLPAGTYTKLTLTTEDPLFVQEGTFGLEDLKITGKTSSNTLGVSLEDFTLTETSTDANPVLIYLTSAPVDFAGKKVTIRIVSENGDVFKCEKTPSKAYAAGAWGGLKCKMQEEAGFLRFDDPAVSRICAENWDTDGDGGLSYDEAAAVTDLGTAFNRADEITSFNELQYFTGLTSMKSSSFYGCSALESIFIPKNVTYIGTQLFSNCSNLKSIVVDSENEVFDSRGDCNAIISKADFEDPYYINGSVVIVEKNTLMAGCSTTIIPDDVEVIRDGAFNGQTELTAITIPNSVKVLEAGSFEYCSSLTSVQVGNSVQSLGIMAFFYCRSLKTITLPESLREIGYMAFMDCIALESITIPEGVEDIPFHAFYHCSNLKDVVLPASTSMIGLQAFFYCGSLSSITINATTPPSLNSGGVFPTMNPEKPYCFHVPQESVEAYKASWSDYADWIVG